MLSAAVAAGCLAGYVAVRAETATPAKPVYDGWVRSSRYVTVRDGTRLAVDLFRPARGGKAAEERLPVVWTHTPYRRAVQEGGTLYTVLDTYGWLKDVLRHGYVVACVDARGTGVSFGTFDGMFNPKETQDSYDVTEWLAAQSWSNGNVGMYGQSYLAITQYMAASRKPPHLRALIPSMGVADVYDFVWKGGIDHTPLLAAWSQRMRQRDRDEPAAVPVDEDPDRRLLRAALEQHKGNRSAAEIFAALPFRDSVDAVSGDMPFRDWAPITFLRQIRESKVAIHHIAGWYDRYVRDQLVLFHNLSNPQRISIGPWVHSEESRFDYAAEHLRWWDYWLKGIDNGVMREEPVYYYVMGAKEGQAWRSARTWPLPQERRTAYWFGRRSREGALGLDAPREKGAKDEMTVDESAAVAPNPRWTTAPAAPDLAANDAKGLSYTTAPLTAPLEVTGHPVVHLWISASAPDVDVFVYLEEVDAKGGSRYVSEGALRASHRATAEPGYDLMGLPYHRGLRADRADLVPGQPVELVLDLFPTSTLFQPGHRIRVTITGADQANTRAPVRTPPPRLTLWRAAGRGSFLELPVIPAAGSTARPELTPLGAGP